MDLKKSNFLNSFQAEVLNMLYPSFVCDQLPTDSTGDGCTKVMTAPRE